MPLDQARQQLDRRHSPAIPKLLQVGGDGGIELRGLGLLLAQRRGEPLHLLLERLAVVFLRLGADVAAGREHVAVLADLLERARSCRSRARRRTAPAASLLAAPGVIGAGDARDVLVGQLAVGAVDHAAELAGVDEEHLAAAVAELAVLLVAREEPEAGGDLRRVEELARQRDHAVHEIGLDDVLADLALAGLVRRHRAVGEHEAGDARGREVMNDVLHPGEVGVARLAARRTASACRRAGARRPSRRC